MRSQTAIALSKAAILAVFALLVIACPDKKAKYPTCEKDTDCKDGETCVNKRCQQCAQTSDCPNGKTCENGACVAGEGYCESDADCPSGLCVNNQCQSCESDNQCGANRRCSNGACLERGACKVNEDCEDDEDCIGGTCQRPGRDRPPELSCNLETVYFGFDQFGIEGDFRAILEKNAECIKSAPAERGVMVYGHTDPRGTEEYNVALSEKRAGAAADFLARLGIDPARLNIVPKGEGEATGTSEDGWTEDRRVNFEWK